MSDSENRVAGTPKRVERYGAEAVPRRLRVNKWHGIFQIQFGNGLSPASMTLPGQAVVLGGLSFGGIFVGIFAGAALALVIGLWGTSLGTRHGIPAAVGFRATYGTLGSSLIISSIRWLTNIYWFALQAIATAMGIAAILNAWLGWDVNTMGLTLTIALIHITLAAVGFGAIQRISRMIWPFGVFPCLLIIYLLATSGRPSHDLLAIMQAPAVKPGFVPVVMFMGIFFGMYISSSTMTGADLSRYTSSSAQAILGYGLATFAGMSLATFTAAYVGLATGIWNPYAAAGELATNGVAYAVLAVGLFAAVLVQNVANVYGAGMALVNVVPSLGRFWSTVATGALGLVACTMPTLINDASGWLAEIGNVFSPLIGVFLVDYLVIKGGAIDVEALFDSRGAYSYVKGINPVAVAAAGMGYAFTKAPLSWVPPQMAGFAASVVVYYVAMRLSARFSWRARVRIS